MAAHIVTQPTDFLTTQSKVEPCSHASTLALRGSSSFAELTVVYGKKAVTEAQTRLQLVLEFKSPKPKTIQLNGRRVPSPAVEQLTERAGVSLGTLWRWYRLYRSGYASAQGNTHLKAKAGFEALIPGHRGKVNDSTEDRRPKVDEELRQAIAGLFTRRHRPSISKVWRKLVSQCPQCKQQPLEPRVKGVRVQRKWNS